MADDSRRANVQLTADTSQYESSMDRAAKSTNTATGAVVKLIDSVYSLTKTVGRGLTIVGGSTLAGLTAATVQAASFESKMATLHASATLAGRSLSGVDGQVNTLRRNFAVTTDQAVQLATQLNKMGQSSSSIGQLSQTFVKLGAVTGESTSGLVDGLVSLQRQMGTTGIQQTEKYASSLANLSNKAGVSATSVLQFANNIAPIGKVAGMTTTQILGVSTAFNKAGADGYAASNAYNKMLTDITRSVQYGSPEVKAYANLIGVSVDQFKKMPKSEVVTEIFEQINKQGPDAIKTLERFGLDGVRTYKSLQAVAAQGGLRSSLADAEQGASPKGQASFEKAAQEALGGFNDQMQKLKNNATMVAEAFGAGLLPAVTGFAKAINMVLSPFAALMGWMGKFPGIATAVAAGALLIGGALLKATSGFGALALGRAVVNGPAGAGLRNVVQGDKAPEWAQNAKASFEDEEKAKNQSMLQRGLYRTGTGLGKGFLGVRDAYRSFRGTTPMGYDEGLGYNNPAPTPIGRRLGQVGGAGIRGGFSLLTTGLDALYPENMKDPLRRNPQTWTSGQAKDFFNRQGDQIKDSASKIKNVFTGGSEEASAAASARAATAATGAAAGLNETTAANTKYRGVVMTLIAESSKLGLALSRASLGVLGGAAGMGMQGAAKGIGMAGSMLKTGWGMIGGGMGAGMIAGTALMTMKSNGDKNMEGIVGEHDSQAAGTAYSQALGIASAATMSFADSVKIAKQKVDANAPSKSDKDARTVSKDDFDKAHGGAKYTNKDVAAMDDKALTSYASAAMAGATPDEINLIKMDVAKRSGSAKKAQSIMDNAGKTQGDLKGMFDSIDEGQGRWGVLENPFGNKKTGQRATMTGDTIKQMLDAMPEGQRNTGILAAFNTSVGAFDKADTVKGRQGVAKAMAQGLGVSEDDTDSQDAIEKALLDASKKGLTGKKAQDFAQNQLANSGTSAGNDLKYAIENGGPDRNVTTLPGAAGQRKFMGGVEQGVQDSVRLSGSNVGFLGMQNNALGKSISAAVDAPDDAHASAQAMNDMTAAAKASGVGFAGAVSDLEKFKNAIGDPTSKLYQLAEATQANIKERQAEAMHNMTRGERAGQIAANYNQARQDAINNPGQKSDADLESARQAQVASQNDAEDYYKSQIAQRRQFDLGNARATTQFNLQQKQGEADYNLSRQQGMEDFTLGRQRQEESYQRSRARGERDYNLSRQQALEDYNLQRARSEEDFGRALKRQTRDYNIGRKQAQDDYNLSRRRSEEDFNHNVEQMAKQTAKTMMNIYDRVQVQQTWSARNLLANMADQQKRAEEQQDNLAKARKMGLSGAAIDMLGLNTADGAQQLARMVADAQNDPGVIAAMNKTVGKRTASGKKLATDPDSESWKETKRSFDLNAKRGQEDFERGMTRQSEAFHRSLNDQVGDYRRQQSRAEADWDKMRKRQSAAHVQQLKDMATDYSIAVSQAETDFETARTRQAAAYATSVARMVAAFKLQMKNAKTDLNTSATEITGSFTDLQNEAMKGLSGLALKQAQTLAANLKSGSTDVDTWGGDVTKNLSTLFASLGITLPGQSAAAPKKDANGYQAGHGTQQGRIEGNGGGGSDGAYQSTITNSPVDHYTLTSGFGPRKSPGGIGSTYHQGYDMAAPTGTPIHAARDGVVTWAGPAQGFGNLVKINHGNGVESLYGHQSHIDARKGQHVKHGDVIGEVGSTGHSTGPHLHFELRVDGKAVDPGNFLKGATIAGGSDSNMNGSFLDMIKNLGGMKELEATFAKYPWLSNTIKPGMIPGLIADKYADKFADASPTGWDPLSGLTFSGGGSAAQNRELGKKMAAKYGWTGGQWDSYDKLMVGESHWNHHATNPDSGAYGIPQALPASKMASAGSDWHDNPATQIKWGLKYIQEVYGNPGNALFKWQNRNPHWYGDGAVFANGAQTIGVGERGPEMVLPLNGRGADFLMTIIKQFTGHDARETNLASRSVPTSSKQITYYSRVDKSTTYTGPINVTTQDTKAFQREMENKKRMDALIGRK